MSACGRVTKKRSTKERKKLVVVKPGVDSSARNRRPSSSSSSSPSLSRPRGVVATSKDVGNDHTRNNGSKEKSIPPRALFSASLERSLTSKKNRASALHSSCSWTTDHRHHHCAGGDVASSGIKHTIPSKALSSSSAKPTKGTNKPLRQGQSKPASTTKEKVTDDAGGVNRPAPSWVGGASATKSPTASSRRHLSSAAVNARAIPKSGRRGRRGTLPMVKCWEGGSPTENNDKTIQSRSGRVRPGECAPTQGGVARGRRSRTETSPPGISRKESRASITESSRISGRSGGGLGHDRALSEGARTRHQQNGGGTEVGTKSPAIPVDDIVHISGTIDQNVVSGNEHEEARRSWRD